ncbi:MAG: BamA/TamA family outer membrane protein, partial [Deltaproteobacteria bacterium]|nr:BamA/TamA family outer membrane protein [Deltaproteobacteria bacterium]
TQVRVSTKPTDRENHIAVTFHVTKGDRLRYAEVFFQGNKAAASGRLYAYVRPMKLYSERRLKNALREMTFYYRNKGYLKAKIRVIEKKIDWEKNRVSLRLRINEGPRVKVFFRGTRHYRLASMKETITLFKEGNFDIVEIQMSAAAIEQRLRQDGYPDAKINYKKERIRPDLYHVVFYIHPGKSVLIKDIAFKGNQDVSDGKLKKQLFNKKHTLAQKGVFQKDLLEEDRKIALEIFRSKGFAHAAVSPPKIAMTSSQTRYLIEYAVEEGPMVFVKAIAFRGLDDFSKKELLKKMENEEGKPFNQTLLPEEKDRVVRFFKNSGYPYIHVIQNFEVDGKAATISYEIEKGPPVRIGEILFVGDVLTGVKPLKKTLGIKTGDPYSEKRVVEAGLNLRRLGTFNAVEVEAVGLEEKETTIPLLITVEERQPFVLDLETQFSTDKRYTGTLKFTNYNSFGWAKQTRMELTGGIDKNRAELSWLDPRFLGADVQMTLAGWMDYEKRAIETSLQTGGAFSFFRQFRRFAFLGRYQLTKTYGVGGQAADPNALRDSVLSEVSLSGSYDRRDSFADPSRGFFTLVGARLFNEIRGLGADFAKLRNVFSYYLTPFHLITFASTMRLDRIQDLVEAASIPQRELYGLGGDDTLRGFGEDRAGPLDANNNPLGGRTRIIFNEEMKIRLSRQFQVAGFYDGGSLTDGLDDISPGTYRNSYGFGLRYITPVGPIRADYGIIIDRQPNESFGRFHLTFGYLF